jgi:hypothetical protein
MAMNQIQDQQLIADIKQQLDSQTLDSNTRIALQKARATALAKPATSWRPLPWLPFAVTASLIAVLAINLPSKKSGPAHNAKPETVATTNTTPTTPKQSPEKSVVSSTQQSAALKAATTEPSADADLLENLELYEDGEFYQWLSEQDTQGVTDA